ncbi:hypothetical protein Tco_0271437 [Tanacetum coccineum]
MWMLKDCQAVILMMYTNYETVYKEWEDRMERAATTASSLEAEQDSGSGPRIGVDTARHKLNTASIKLVLPGIS